VVALLAGGSLPVGPSLSVLGGVEGERFELFCEFAQAAVVLEPGLVALELFGGEAAGDGLA